MTGVADAPAFELRPATHDDTPAIETIAEATWTDRAVEDYLPRVFEDWLENDRARTVVAEVDADVVTEDAPAIAGIAQCTMLSDDEAWAQGMRVHPAYRGHGVGTAIVADAFDWAREQGATVVRNMVFSWNGAGLGQSRATGFEPATEIRFVHPTPDPSTVPTAVGGDAFEVAVDPDAAWRFWTHSDARAHLRGLAADDEETWTLRELTRDDLETAATDGGVLVVVDDSGTAAMTVRSRIDRRTVTDDEGSDGDDAAAEDADAEDGDVACATSDDRVTAVYGATAWRDQQSAAVLFDAIAADAATVGADETKVLVPETVRAVSDAAACRVALREEPEFVLAADPEAGLTRR